MVKEFCHLGFVNDLHPSSGILSLSFFLFGDLHSIEESFHLGFVSDLHSSSEILPLRHFLLSDLHSSNGILSLRLR